MLYLIDTLVIEPPCDIKEGVDDADRDAHTRYYPPQQSTEGFILSPQGPNPTIQQT